MKKLSKKVMSLLLAVCVLVTLVGCGSSADTSTSTTGGADSSEASSSVHPGEGATKMGVILVGARDDMGYNQALYECCMSAEDELGLEVLVKDNVPEDSSCEAVMEELIAQGCKLIYATSIGHREYMEEVAASHPDVAFYTCNSTGNDMDNVCVLTTNLWDSAYVNGVAAGLMTETNELGYIASFQIPVVMASINAFALGAQSVNPDATVHAVFTGSWSDVGLQTNAIDSMASQNIDVIAQFQDYTKSIVEHCEELGVYSIGYHCDTSSLGPNTFIIGTLDTFVKQYEVFQAAMDGKFEPGIVRGGFEEGMCANTPVADFCPEEVKTAVQEVEDKMAAGEFTAFTGPIYKQDGTLVYEEGYVATDTELDGCDFFVKGVIGEEN